MGNSPGFADSFPAKAINRAARQSPIAHRPSPIPDPDL